MINIQILFGGSFLNFKINFIIIIIIFSKYKIDFKATTLPKDLFLGGEFLKISP